MDFRSRGLMSCRRCSTRLRQRVQTGGQAGTAGEDDAGELRDRAKRHRHASEGEGERGAAGRSRRLDHRTGRRCGGLPDGNEGEKAQVTTGDYNKVLDQAIARIKSTCGIN